MTLEECTALLTPFALAMRWDVDGPTFRAYHQALEHLQASDLDAALATARRQPRAFPPSAPELVALAESCRIARRQSLPFESCGNCSQQGWIEREIHGVMRTVRCECWKAHQAHLARLGAGDQPLALPAGREDWTEGDAA